MTEEEIKKKIDHAISINSELPDLELKTASGGIPQEIWKSISAFSQRSKGGVIVFGIKESPVSIVGCHNLKQLQDKLGEYFNQRMSYPLRPSYHVLKYGDKTVLAVYIPECPDDFKPCYFVHAGITNGAYTRDGHTNRKLTDNEVRTYMAYSKQFQFDSSRAEHATVEDLSEEKVKNLLEKKEGELNRGAMANVTKEVLRNIGIIKEFNGSLSPTLAGYLIFSKDDPQKKYPYERYAIRCVRYSGADSSSDVLDRADITGTIDQQIDQVYKFVLKNIGTTLEIRDTKHHQKYEYPEQALRELLSNAVIHRDYKIIETFTSINIFSDRIEISNPGNLPPGVTVDNIREARFSRNSIIAGRLRDLGYLEEYGRGINIVFEKMEEWHLPAPLFRNSVNNFQAILLGARYKGLNLRQVSILDNLLLRGRLTIKDCVGLLRPTPRITIASDLKKLINLKVLEKRGASVNTYYVLKI